MILALAVSLLAVAAFAVVLWVSRIVTVMRAATSMTMAGLAAMMDSELDDETKEVAVRQAGIGLIVASFNILWRFAAALAAAAAPIFLAEGLGLVSSDAVFSMMLRLDYIVIVSVVAIILAEILRRVRKPTQGASAETSRYSTADRFFHVVAFSSPAVLKSASWLEDRLVSKPDQAPTGPPIFITSLARGGTTALLNAMHDIPGIATHTYRDMPFLTAPTLWNRLAGRKREVTRHQRAHGDGLEIDLDSPEAFEEVLWKMFWPEQYGAGSIALWPAGDRKKSAEAFLERQFSKVIAARLSQGQIEPADRLLYCSKNNGNIARIPYLLEAFPGCRIVVPVRRPESHGASLLRQHENFLTQQAEDDFIKRYMRDIGHFEFGQIHKPVEFPGLERNTYDPSTPDYWLAYWICAFRHIQTLQAHCIFVLQDDLRAQPQETMTALCRRLDLGHVDMDFSAYFRAGVDHRPSGLYAPELLKEATELYRALETAALRANQVPVSAP